MLCDSRKYSYPPQGRVFEKNKNQNVKGKDEQKLEFLERLGSGVDSGFFSGGGAPLRNGVTASSQVGLCAPCALPLDMPLEVGGLVKLKIHFMTGIDIFWYNTTGMMMRVWKTTGVDNDCTII